MKKVYVFLMAFLGIVQPLFSQSSKLEIFSEEGNKFWLILNGVKQNAKPLVKVKVPGLQEKIYKLKIIFEDEKNPQIDYKLNMTESGGLIRKDYVLSIKKKDNKNVIRVVSSKWSDDQGEEAPPAATEASEVKTTTPKPVKGTQNNSGSGNNVSMSMNDEESGMSFSMDMNVEEEDIEMSETTTTTTKTSTASPKPTSCRTAMNSVDFDNAKKSISTKGMEQDKLKIAKQVIKNNCMNTTQVKAIMKLFGFEESKLDFAKAAYSRTTDKNNYYTVNDAFGFSQSIEELDEFINNQ